MTQKFQAGAGPHMNKVHIYELGSDPKMSLCEAVVIARDYRAEVVIDHPVMCKRCWKKFEKAIGEKFARYPIAADLGVSDLKFWDQKP